MVDDSKLKFVLPKLVSYFSDKDLNLARQCANHLIKNLPYCSVLSANKVLVAYGGGKDSSYMLAYVRLLQLLILEDLKDTFQMRVTTNRHSGMPYAVMENIDRVYAALGMYGDPTVEMLVVDGHEVSNFEKDKLLPKRVREIDRKNVVMGGHRTNGDGRPTFCNACNISMVNSFGVSAWYEGGVNVIITGDSKREQKEYYIWVKRLVKSLGSNLSLKNGFQDFLQGIDIISYHYFREILGEDSTEEITSRRIVLEKEPQALKFFSIYEYTQYDVNSHWELLTEFLDFRFDDLAFSFSESDCANPALMAHMRGLKAERFHQRQYSDGILDYLKLALKIMRSKNFPEFLISKAISRYIEDDGIPTMRNKLNAFAKEAYNLSEEQLVCIVYSPFFNEGRNLELYLTREQSDLLSDLPRIHTLFSSQIYDDSHLNLINRLIELSGLTFTDMCILYNSCFDATKKTSLMSRILDDDPHKTVIKTQHSIHGPVIEELISGR